MPNRKIFIPGKGELTLSDTDHVATGGEGSVYVKKGLAFKLFLDPVMARNAGLESKIKLLSAIKHPYIVAPDAPVYDAQQQMIGFSMPLAKGVPLIKTFANGWRDQNSFGMKESAQLVDNMRTAVQAAHGVGALLVDGNEMNYMADGVTPQLIDVDSWQIDRFKGTALMPSIRDYHHNNFSAETDWFAWAIVSFQVFSGIHPYKGTHPDFKKGDMEARMRANASVFDSKVRLNSAVRDLTLIPPSLAAWYEGVFQRGERSTPPSALAPAVAPHAPRRVRVVSSGQGHVRHDLLVSLPSDVRHVSTNGVALYQTADGWKAMDLHRKQMLSKLTSAQIAALFGNQAALVRHDSHFVYLELDGPEIKGTRFAGDNDPQPTDSSAGKLTCFAEKLIVFGNRVFALNGHNDSGMTELSLDSLGSKVILSVKAVWPVTTRSTRFFDGFGLLDALGKPFLVVPDESALVIKRAPGLNEYRVVSGYSRGPNFVLLSAISRADGKLYRLTLKASAGQFDIQSATVTDEPDLNVALNAKGILVSIEEDGELLVSNTLGSGAKQVQDSSLSREMALFTLPDGVYYRKGPGVYKLSLA